MKTGSKRILIGMLLAIAIVFWGANTTFSSDLVYVTGTINSEHQFVSEDGEIFKIAETGRGSELQQLVGSTVKVEGKIEEHDEMLVLNVLDFSVLNDDT